MNRIRFANEEDAIKYITDESRIDDELKEDILKELAPYAPAIKRRSEESFSWLQNTQVNLLIIDQYIRAQ